MAGGSGIVSAHCTCAVPAPMTVMHKRGGGAVVCRGCALPVPSRMVERVIIHGERVAEIRELDPLLIQPARIGGDEA